MKQIVEPARLDLGAGLRHGPEVRPGGAEDPRPRASGAHRRPAARDARRRQGARLRAGGRAPRPDPRARGGAPEGRLRWTSPSAPRALPTEPGVYLFKNERGGILYIGKAQNLRSRVRSYLSGGDGRFQVPQLLERARDVDVVVTRNVKDALLLENELIKRHKPPFNVRLRDDKQYLGPAPRSEGRMAAAHPGAAFPGRRCAVLRPLHVERRHARRGVEPAADLSRCVRAATPCFATIAGAGVPASSTR